jgi:hypothetical protein
MGCPARSRVVYSLVMKRSKTCWISLGSVDVTAAVVNHRRRLARKRPNGHPGHVHPGFPRIK